MLTAHPTVKPVALVADAMRDCTTKGDIVLDPFLGSGTTILAAEKVGRRGFGLECEPRYIDVAIRRWETHTKAEAILEGDGRTYAEVKAERLEASHGREFQPAVAPLLPNADRNPRNADNNDEVDGDWTALCQEVPVNSIKGGRDE